MTIHTAQQLYKSRGQIKLNQNTKILYNKANVQNVLDNNFNSEDAISIENVVEIMIVIIFII